MPNDRLDQAIRAFQEGRAVVLQDDPDRENEGDLIIAAEMINEEIMAMMIRDCSGIVCLCVEDDLARRLDLPQMVARNDNKQGTAFTVAIEASSAVGANVSKAVALTVAIEAGSEVGAAVSKAVALTAKHWKLSSKKKMYFKF